MIQTPFSKISGVLVRGHLESLLLVVSSETTWALVAIAGVVPESLMVKSMSVGVVVALI